MAEATTGDPRLNPRMMTFGVENWRDLDNDLDESLCLETATRSWRLTALHQTADNSTVNLGWAVLRVFQIWEIGWNQKTLCDLADEEGWDILDLFQRNWMDRVPDPTDLGPTDLLVLENIFVEKEFRGNGLGPLIGGMAIQGVRSSDTTYAVCYPAPFEKYPNKTKKQAIESLGRTWAKLGFEHLNDGVWGLDLQTTTFDNAFNKVTTNAFDTLPDTWDD